MILNGKRVVVTCDCHPRLSDDFSPELTDRLLGGAIWGLTPPDAETRLEESERNAVIVALAGTAAHELNQPLTSVMGYAELLRRKLKESDFAYRPVDIIYREAERMAEIVAPTS